MATLTDYQLVEQIQLGQGEALGQLFDRYGGGVFDFLARVVGDPDEAVHLVVDVFSRFPESAAGIQAHESVRGILFSLAREIALDSLLSKGWLDSLRAAPSAISSSDLANDIWQAARTMPASQRAVLAIVEHQALSPMEQATALGVARHALPDVIAEARHAFNRLYDFQAQAQGKPTSHRIDADHVPGLQRRIPDPDASLFTLLPALVLTNGTRVRSRNQIVAALEGPKSAPVVLPPPVLPTEFTREPSDKSLLVPALLVIALIAAVLASVLAVVAVNANQQTAVIDTTAPVIKQVTPPDGALLPPEQRVVVQAIYGDDQGVDVKSVRLLVDNRDVTSQASVSDTTVSYSAVLGPGQHVALVELKDMAGNPSSQTWIFTISTATPTASPPPTQTPIPTATNGPTSTPPPTATRAPTPSPIPTATQTPAPALPDLVVTDISLSPNDQIVYAIGNNGPGDVTQPFLIQVYVDNTPVDSNRKVSSLGAGQEISLYVPNYTLSGTHSVTVRVNADLALQESNYRNDELIRTLSGPTPTPLPSITPTR